MAILKKKSVQKTPKMPKSDDANSKSQQKSWPFIVFIIAWVLVAMIICQLVIGCIMIFCLRQQFNRPIWTGVYYALSYGASLFLIIYVTPRFSKKFKTNLTEIGFSRWPTFVDIGLAPIAYIVYIFCANFITSLMANFPWFNADQDQDVGFSYLASGLERFIAVVALVFIAPIAEEIIMRGWLYGKMRSKLKVLPAILLTSLVFAVLHGQWNVGVTVFMLSVVLCGLREITGNIWSGIILHMLTNGIAFYLLYVVGMV